MGNADREGGLDPVLRIVLAKERNWQDIEFTARRRGVVVRHIDHVEMLLL